MKTLTQMSKLIALVLRHKPQELGLSMDAHGWVSTDALVRALNDIQPFTMETLEEIVRTDNKGRYAFNVDKSLIRARQGHSVPVDLGLEPADPPSVLWHGTATRFVESIMQQGLLPMNRQYVHLSPDLQTARTVGRRHGKLAVFEVDVASMADDGRKFYISENGVWLTDEVPPRFLTRVE